MGLKESGLRGSLRNVSVGTLGIPDSGLARYRLEENVNDEWFDNDATSTTSLTFSTDSYEGSFAGVFNGTDTEAQLPFAPASEWSVAVAFKTTANQVNFGSFFVGSTGGTQEGVAVGMASGDNSTAGSLFIQSGGGGSARIVGGTSAFDDGNYHLATFGRDGTDAVIYVDGSEEVRQSLNQYTINENWRLGDKGSDGGRTYDGLADDYRFYDKKLSLTEHQNLFNTGSIDG